MADVLKRVPVREQDPQVRAKNFDEVCLGYNAEEAVEETAEEYVFGEVYISSACITPSFSMYSIISFLISIKISTSSSLSTFFINSLILFSL